MVRQTIKTTALFAVMWVAFAIAVILVTTGAKGETFIPHPAGCPRSNFCGCGGSVAVFGKPVRELFLAANWRVFPRTAPAPGMAAVRAGHMFVLRRHVSGDTWLVEDYNSGGRRSRMHHRSIRGYTIHNPHGITLAAAVARTQQRWQRQRTVRASRPESARVEYNSPAEIRSQL